MQKEIRLSITPKAASQKELYYPLLAKKLHVSVKDISAVDLLSKSIDARQKNVKINLHVRVYINEDRPKQAPYTPELHDVSKKEPVIVVGAGPAGLFAGLKLIALGYRPIILERGKDVRERKKDIAKIHRNLGVLADSNYAFGEGGAGTFSDGKLYTRSKKRGNVKEFLQKLSFFGADENILTDAYPHVGTDKLPRIIENIRKQIIDCGGAVLFNHKVDRIIIKNHRIEGVISNGEKYESKSVILATGHSARDIYYLLHELGVTLEAKSFAMGVRVEHPQTLIDSIQYHSTTRSKYLPSATYKLVQQIENRGVYSFCMCPGGIVVPASTDSHEMVVNGMSPSHRNTRWANAAIVTEIRTDDLNIHSEKEVLKGLAYQQMYEHLAFENGGEGQIAPAQRLNDFIHGKISQSLPRTSFNPGLKSSNMKEWMPERIISKLVPAMKAFDRKMKGYDTNEAVVIGVESRTSSPIRIPRDRATFQHPEIAGLFPCGEGAGYAGGIASSAIDGENCAQKAVEFMKHSVLT
ncbi:MAG: FAD-binding protein [Bacteroidetes bacterium]|nr:MAG: FAD-binding protein [Bacteroidota bacterium]